MKEPLKPDLEDELLAPQETSDARDAENPERAELISRLEEELSILERSMPERQRDAVLDRAMKLFAVRCDLQDILDQMDAESLKKLFGVPGESLRLANDEQRVLNAGTLKSEFNIDYPERYPESVLESMLEDGPVGSWGIVVVAKSDHNGAFSRTPQLMDLQENLKGDVGIKIVEAGSAKEGADLMRKLAAKYGRFSFGICLAHGSEEGFSLEDKDEGGVLAEESEEDIERDEQWVNDEMDDSTARPTEENEEENPPEDEYGVDSSLAVFGKAFSQCSEKSATLVMVSCSTGRGSNPVGRQLARVMKRRTIAPDGDSNVETYNATTHGSQVDFEPEYDGAKAKEFTP